MLNDSGVEIGDPEYDVAYAGFVRGADRLADEVPARCNQLEATERLDRLLPPGVS